MLVLSIKINFPHFTKIHEMFITQEQDIQKQIINILFIKEEWLRSQSLGEGLAALTHILINLKYKKQKPKQKYMSLV